MSDGKLFDLSAITDPNEQRETLVHLAKTAELAERFDDMARLMKDLVMWANTQSLDLNIEERNLLSVAYKNVIGGRRASWRSIKEHEEEMDERFMTFHDALRTKVADEIEEICSEVLDLLENYLVKHASRNRATGEAKVFYIKMLGDYYRYRAESCDSKNYHTKAAEYYEEAYKLSQTVLEPTHPIRLGLALNYSVCFYEILKQPAEACQLARRAFDDAIAKLDQLPEHDYKDSTLIMQLLRDNLTLWTSDEPAEDDIGAVEDA
jgi:tetratricopeptide (TPR) repeat protein